MAFEDALFEAISALWATSTGIVLVSVVVGVVAAWRGLGLARRRLAEDLAILKEILVLQESLADPATLGIDASYPLDSARRWQHVAYGWSAGKRLAFWGIIGAAIGVITLSAGTSAGLLIAGAVISGLALVMVVVVLAAVVFVLVSNLGSIAPDGASHSSEDDG